MGQDSLENQKQKPPLLANLSGQVKASTHTRKRPQNLACSSHRRTFQIQQTPPPLKKWSQSPECSQYKNNLSPLWNKWPRRSPEQPKHSNRWTADWQPRTSWKTKPPQTIYKRMHLPFQEKRHIDEASAGLLLQGETNISRQENEQGN